MNDIGPDDLVLVGVTPLPRDLEIARVLGWYRIPLRSAPKTLRVEWMAFFQTGAFGEERWSVRRVAEVRGFELTERRELLHEEASHPRSTEPYFKVQLGPIRTLPRAIIANRQRRFTFLYTTGSRLLAAREIKDLRVRSGDEHDLLWRMLRDRSIVDGDLWTGRPMDQHSGQGDSI